MKTANDELVCIIWRDDPKAQGIDTLTYGDGKIRTYYKDAIDHRAGKTVYVNSLVEVFKWLKMADSTKLAVPVSIARKFGDETWVFDER